MSEDITNKVLGKLFSLEALGLLVVLGVMWGTQTAKTEALASEVSTHGAEHSQDIQKLQESDARTSKDISEMRRDISVMRTNQDHFKDTMVGMAKQQERLDEKLDDIREILMKQYPNGGG